jgi:XTP/dITP diphosphohydrolase
MREILLATSNPGKAREMREILVGGDPVLDAQVRWRNLAEFADWPEAVEDAETFPENASKKAMHYARLSGMWSLADDSGLEVDALDGAPGVRSARYAGEPKNDESNNRLLLEKLRGIPIEQRTARFRCAAALSDGEQVLATAEGKVEGCITDQPRGSNGFGYDPLFLVECGERTAAEMSPDEKHAVSHRGRALQQMRAKLLELLGGPDTR